MRKMSPRCCNCGSNRIAEPLYDAVYIKKCVCGASGILLKNKKKDCSSKCKRRISAKTT